MSLPSFHNNRMLQTPQRSGDLKLAHQVFSQNVPRTRAGSLPRLLSSHRADRFPQGQLNKSRHATRKKHSSFFKQNLERAIELYGDDVTRSRMFPERKLESQRYCQAVSHRNETQRDVRLKSDRYEFHVMDCAIARQSWSAHRSFSLFGTGEWKPWRQSSTSCISHKGHHFPCSARTVYGTELDFEVSRNVPRRAAIEPHAMAIPCKIDSKTSLKQPENILKDAEHTSVSDHPTISSQSRCPVHILGGTRLSDNCSDESDGENATVALHVGESPPRGQIVLPPPCLIARPVQGTLDPEQLAAWDSLPSVGSWLCHRVASRDYRIPQQTFQVVQAPSCSASCGLETSNEVGRESANQTLQEIENGPRYHVAHKPSLASDSWYMKPSVGSWCAHACTRVFLRLDGSQNADRGKEVSNGNACDDLQLSHSKFLHDDNTSYVIALHLRWSSQPSVGSWLQFKRPFEPAQGEVISTSSIHVQPRVMEQSLGSSLSCPPSCKPTQGKTSDIFEDDDQPGCSRASFGSCLSSLQRCELAHVQSDIGLRRTEAPWFTQPSVGSWLASLPAGEIAAAKATFHHTKKAWFVQPSVGSWLTYSRPREETPVHTIVTSSSVKKPWLVLRDVFGRAPHERRYFLSKLRSPPANSTKTTSDVSALHAAAHDGDALRLTHLLRARAVPDQPRADGVTPLHFAAQGGHLAASTVLLQWGSTVDSAGPGGFTPLHDACCHGHFGVANALLIARASVDANAEDGTTPLHGAAGNGHDRVVDLLLAQGGFHSPTSAGGFTPLHDAAHGGHPVIVRRLIEAGAQLTRSNDGATPLHFAIKRGHSEVEAILRTNFAPRRQERSRKKRRTIRRLCKQESVQIF